jgi:hypothetical protein
MRRLAMLLGLVGAAGTAALVASPSSTPLSAGTGHLTGSLRVVSQEAPCPPEAPPDAGGCRARTGKGTFPGLGSVTEIYNWFYRIGPPSCPADAGKPLAATGRLVIAGKGEIRFSLADGKGCVDIEPLRNEPQDFTITGGTGAYEGASGSGTLDRSLSGGFGSDMWTGTLVVPGLEFDVTPPTLNGATSKTVRARRGAKRVRVAFTVTASDAKDGQVPVICVPRSGSRFPIARTVVKCSATDKSANTSAASFRVTVRPA